MVPRTIPHTNERAHEMRKVVALKDYERWCETHASEADAEAVRAAIQRVLQRAERA
jgi:hypothetical protein